MSLRIYETDDTARAPKRVQYDAPDFRLRGGLLTNGRPQALSEWAFSTDERGIATTLHQNFGGTLEEPDEDSESVDLLVLSETKGLDILIDGPKALTAVMVLYGMDRKPIHRCDGAYSLLEDDKGEPCGCPPVFRDRKALAQKGRGPSPEIKLRFQLADHPDLGVGLYRTGSWTFVRDLPEIEEQLEARYDGTEPVRANIALEYVSFTNKAGMDVSYHRPEITFP